MGFKRSLVRIQSPRPPFRARMRPSGHRRRAFCAGSGVAHAHDRAHSGHPDADCDDQYPMRPPHPRPCWASASGTWDRSTVTHATVSGASPAAAPQAARPAACATRSRRSPTIASGSPPGSPRSGHAKGLPRSPGRAAGRRRDRPLRRPRWTVRSGVGSTSPWCAAAWALGTEGGHQPEVPLGPTWVVHRARRFRAGRSPAADLCSPLSTKP